MSPLFLAIVGITIAAAPTQRNGRDQTPPLGTTRIAVVNIGQVFNHYDRAKAFKADLEKTLKPFKDEANRITKNSAKWKAAIDNMDFQAATKEEYEEKIINAKRQLEDMSRKIQVELGAKQEQNLVTLWKEVQIGIKTVATHHKVDVVFGYGDPIEKELLDLFPNVNRKMQAMDLGSTVPLFTSPRADISDEVVRNLNRWVREPKKDEPRPPIDF